MRASDAPKYHNGFIICICLVSAGLLFAILQSAQYRWSNRKFRHGELELEGRIQHYHA